MPHDASTTPDNAPKEVAHVWVAARDYKYKETGSEEKAFRLANNLLRQHKLQGSSLPPAPLELHWSVFR